ncbi:MAG: hypothetical protein R3C59_26950 [Planctomycetaceae bacterium]
MKTQQGERQMRSYSYDGLPVRRAASSTDWKSDVPVSLQVNSDLPHAQAESVWKSVSSLINGLASAVISVQIVVTWQTICGTSTESLATLSFAVAVGLLLGRRAALALASDRPRNWRLVCVLLAVVACGLPMALDGLLTLGVAAFGSTVSHLAFIVPGTAVTLQTTLLAAWISSPFGTFRQPQQGLPAVCIFGVACGLLVTLLHALVVLPIPLTVVAALLPAMAGQWLAAASGVPALRSESAGQPRSDSAAELRVTAALATGLAIHAGLRFHALLMPMSASVILPAGAITLLLVPLLRISPRPLRLLSVLLLAAWPLAFGWLIDLNLSWNATVSSTGLLTLLRTMQLALFWVPAVVWCSSAFRSEAADIRHTAAMVSLGVAGGLLIAVAGVTPQMQLLGALLLSLFSQGADVVPTRGIAQTAAAGSNRSRRVAEWTVAGASLMMILAANPDGAKSTQMLFNGRFAQAVRAGMDRDLIEQSHCARLLEQHSPDGGLLTVWRLSGDQVLLRRNGCPSGRLSTNLLTTPQPIEETLTTVLPLVMHRHAQSVLLLGDDSGIGLRACCHFPVHTIEAVRPDEDTTDVARRYTWNSSDTDYDNDDRVTIRHQDIAVAVRNIRRADQRFDVVVAASSNSGSAAGQAFLSTPFYHAVRSQLTDDGVFCQRLVQHDLGAEPLIRIASALREVFGRVVLLQMAPGEVAVIASVASDALLDKGLLGRLRRDHAVRELGLSGWDWSQVAALPIVDTHDPVGIFEHRSTLAASTADNGWFAFALPLETIRWGDKSGELQREFAPHQRRLADAAPRTDDYQEFARRYSAVVQQREILTSFPDNPWPYRKSLKVEMQRNPRPPRETIVDGKVVQAIDPKDTYRKDYFLSLGQLLKQAARGSVDPLAIREFDRFATRYEPLLSYFAAYELIRIHEMTGHPSPALELRNRLHTIYFAEPGDLSVRQLSAALLQVLEDPELLANTQERYDQVNSLLQELVHRWEARHGYNPLSARRTQLDVDECVRVANLALDAMSEWGVELEISNDHLTARRRFINQSLISPLRTYREQVLAHRIKTAVPSDEDDLPGPDDLPLMVDPPTALTN